MPGCVNCPVPAFKSVTGQPIVINSVKGFHIYCTFGENLNLDSPRIPHYLFLLGEYILFNDIGYWSSDPASNIILQQQNIRSHFLSTHSPLSWGKVKSWRTDSPGVQKGATYETLTAPFNDISAVENLFETNKGEIAAIILEPVVGNSASWCIWREIMEMVAPTGPIYQAGFLNGNPLAMK
nr:glutamate-1-semialdehyde 2,1-aminomutase 2, chloroplastic [Quercus suber]